MLDSILFHILAAPEIIKLNRETRRWRKEREKNLKTAEDVNWRIQQAEALGASDLELAQIKADTVISYCNNLKERQDKIDKINEELIEKVLDTASNVPSGMKRIDSELEKKIDSLQSLKDRYTYKETANRSQRLINYALWKATDTKAIGLSILSDGDKMFINGIAKEIHAEPIYNDKGTLDLDEYDPWKSGWNNQEYLINLNALHRLVTVNMQERINRKINTAFTTSNGGYSPVRFMVNSGSVPLIDPDKVVDSYNLSLLESAIAPYYPDGVPEHHFEVESTIFKGFIKNPNNDVVEVFNFNIGYYGKDVVSLLATTTLGMTVCIHPEAKDLWEKILKNCFYQLSDIETTNIMRHISNHFYLYNQVDLSVIPESDIVGLLDIKLDAIFRTLQSSGIALAPRYGFEKYNAIYDFILNGSDNSLIIYNGNEACYRLGVTYKQFQI